MIAQIQEEYILCFTLNEIRIGLFLKDIYRAIRSVNIMPLPGAPPIVMGIINIAGEVIPIVDFRSRLKLRAKTISPDDKIIIVLTDTLHFGFYVDEILGMQSIEQNQYSSTNDILPGFEHIVEGVFVVNNEMVIVHDIQQFLTTNEEVNITKALKKKTKSND